MKKLATVLVLVSCACRVGYAQQGQGDWDLRAGIIVRDRPTYEGSDHTTTEVGPFVSFVWRDRVALDGDGLKLYWRGDTTRVGVGVTYAPERLDRNTSGAFTSGDDRLKGLQEIGGAVGFRAFASQELGPVVLDLSGTRFDGLVNKGVLGSVGVGAPLHPGPRLTLTPRVGAVWANRSYMRTFFGVTPTEAADSPFRPYAPEQGIKNVTAGVDVRYVLT